MDARKSREKDFGTLGQDRMRLVLRKVWVRGFPGAVSANDAYAYARADTTAGAAGYFLPPPFQLGNGQGQNLPYLAATITRAAIGGVL